MMRDVLLEEVDDGIFCCLAPAPRHSDYDSKVRAYDLLVGNRYYKTARVGELAFTLSRVAEPLRGACLRRTIDVDSCLTLPSLMK